MRIRILACIVLIQGIAAHAASAPAQDYPIQPVPFTQVTFEDDFWQPRLEVNRTVTLPACFQKCEDTGRISNFSKAAGLMEGKHEGIFFNDSDVFKVTEGAAYTLMLHDDPELTAYLDKLIALIAKAQEADGYLYTARTIDPANPAGLVAKERWGNVRTNHELYNMGHMYEAAAAHYLATGKDTFLKIAQKNADLVAQVFGPHGRHEPPGHEEIEMGLVKLYRITKEQRYLDLAKFFVERRGRREKRRRLFGEYSQDKTPITEESEAVGHAVRAGYYYAGAADVAALTGEQKYIDAIDRIWENVVSKKQYITGGTAAQHRGEAFGDNYELPNLTAYNESCAAIANCFWNHRMFLLHGDAKYMDVFERTLYNNVVTGVSFEGDTYFYPNPLTSDGIMKFNKGDNQRQPWFECACCPSNFVRVMPSLPGYVYAHRDDKLYVNLFVAGKGKVEVNGTPVELVQEGNYPWDGDITLAVKPIQALTMALHIRIPGWTRNEPMPSDLYRYAKVNDEQPVLKVNAETVPIALQKGYAVITRTWNAGDKVTLQLPMPIRRVLCHEAVEANRGRVALERGPLVYCAEWVDNNGRALNLCLPDDAALVAEVRPDLLKGMTVITSTATAVQRDDSGSLTTQEKAFTAIPYHLWCYRGPGEMAVWLPRTVDAVPPPLPN